MKYTVVMPYIYEPYKKECLETCKFSDVLLVNNTRRNRGIMASHNLGIKKMYRDDSDWLIIMSAAIRFGKPGGLDFINELKKKPDYLVVESAGVFGWHLIAFSRKVIEAVGYWDENFTPYGFDDLDYAWRIKLAFNLEPPSWTKVIVNVNDMGMAHGIHLTGVTANTDKLREYFKIKWGIYPGESAENAWKHPFNNPSNGLDYCPRLLK